MAVSNKTFLFCVLLFYTVQHSASSRIPQTKCFDQKLRGIETTVELFSNDLREMREEIGHLSLAISSLVNHFKIKPSPRVETNKKRMVPQGSSKSKAGFEVEINNTIESNFKGSNSTGGCPDDGVWLGEECFAYFDENVKWSTARKKCQEMGGDLAVPNDVDSFLEWLSGWETIRNDTSYAERKMKNALTEYGDIMCDLETLLIGAGLTNKEYTIFLPAPWVGATFGDRFINLYGNPTYVGRAWQWLDGDHLSVDDPNWSYERPKYDNKRCVSLYDNSRVAGPGYKLYEEICEEKLTFICEF